MTGAPHNPRRTALVCLALLAGTVALFSRSLGLGFIDYDDPTYVVNNPQVQRGLTWEGVRWAFAVGRDFWHPLTWLSLMADCELYGDDARGFHATNVAWHAACAILVFVIVRRLLGGVWAAAVCAALWAWHPLRVESVTWITERKDVLSGFFGLLAVWCHLRHGAARAAGARGWRGARWYLAGCGALACGLMAKSVLVTLPFVLLLLDRWPLDRAGGAVSPYRRWSELMAEKTPHLLLALAAGLATLATQDAAGAFTLPLGWEQRVANACVAVVRYLGLVAWPSGLAVVYPHPGHWPWVVVAACAGAIGAVSWAAWWWRDRLPWLVLGWGWFLALLLPVLGLLQVGLQSMADRYTYLPAVGVTFVLVGAACAVLRPMGPVARRGAGVATLVVFGVLGVRTWQQQAVWRDAETLFAHALAVTRDNYVAHTAVALAHLGAGRLDEAAGHAERAAVIAPDAPLAIDTLAVVRLEQGRVEEAEAGFRRVIALQPSSVAARTELGRILLRQRRLDEAATLFAEALELRPAWRAAHVGLADVDGMRGDIAGALQRLERARALWPRDPDLALRAASVAMQLGRSDVAVAALGDAAALLADNAAAQRDLGDAFGRLRRFPEAVAAYRRAVDLEPRDAATYARLGYALHLQGDVRAAIAAWERGLELDPSMGDIRDRLRDARAALEAGR